jgi:hypothetical protein
MPSRVRISPLQRSILEVAKANGGRVWSGLLYRELALVIEPEPGRGKAAPIPAATRAAISRSLSRLGSRGMLEKDTGGWWLPGSVRKVPVVTLPRELGGK